MPKEIVITLWNLIAMIPGALSEGKIRVLIDGKEIQMILSRRELEALEQISRRGTDEFWWRPASMRKLAKKGFVERNGGTDTCPAWRITDAGREHLRGFPK